MEHRKRVYIESPYRGDILRNEAYAKVAMLDSINRGEAPFLGHLLYTQILNDSVEAERSLGIALGSAWLLEANLVAFYIDLGWSPGMIESLRLLKTAKLRIPHETRRVKEDVLNSFR